MNIGFKTGIHDNADLGDLLVPRHIFSSIDGSINTFGYNGYGQLGTNDMISRSSPVQIVANNINWRYVECGLNHMAAIRSDGTLWLWGRNYYGELGNNTVVNNSSPVQVYGGGTWKSVSCGDDFTAAIKSDNTLWVWGNAQYGKLGLSAYVHRSSPTQTIATGTTWVSVSTGAGHTAAIKTDGTLWLWGSNWLGELGINTETIQSTSSLVQVYYGGTWACVACGGQTTAAIKTDGTLWTWGNNNSTSPGTLGRNTIPGLSYSLTPATTIAGGSNWRYVTLSSIIGYGIKTDGTLWTWGGSAVQVYGGGTTWKKIKNSNDYSQIALKTDGTVWTWGYNTWGQLGINTTDANYTSVPQQILVSETVKDVATKGYSVAVILSVE